MAFTPYIGYLKSIEVIRVDRNMKAQEGRLEAEAGSAIWLHHGIGFSLKRKLKDREEGEGGPSTEPAITDEKDREEEGA
ncbi:hypothetical protein SDJN02_10455, partial [Cucurbita argyrosperma subsp. argyrosperma]